MFLYVQWLGITYYFLGYHSYNLLINLLISLNWVKVILIINSRM